MTHLQGERSLKKGPGHAASFYVDFSMPSFRKHRQLETPTQSLWEPILRSRFSLFHRPPLSRPPTQ